jgi:four helix bundle protein
MLNVNNLNKPKFDLEDRTSKFAEDVVLLCKRIPKSDLIKPILIQLIRSGTSIGANYCEANGASSKKDFANKIIICKKEAKETQYWLNLLGKSLDNDDQTELSKLWSESIELGKIFSAIAQKSKA